MAVSAMFVEVDRLDVASIFGRLVACRAVIAEDYVLLILTEHAAFTKMNCVIETELGRIGHLVSKDCEFRVFTKIGNGLDEF